MDISVSHDQGTEHRIETFLLGGSSSETIAGVAAIVLSIIGLAGIAAHYMVTISAIALGAGLLFEGGFIAAEYSRLVSQVAPTGAAAKATLGGGLSAEALAGVAAVVLGILALLNIVPEILVSISSIVLGAGVMMGSGVLSSLNALKIETSGEHAVTKRVAHDAMTAAAGAQVLVGLSAIVLGILALIGIVPQTLNLVAMLALGSAVVLSGGAVVARTLSYFGAH